MSNPLTVLPFALAAAGGHVDSFGAAQLVTAGITLLQRSAPLVRVLAGHRAAILLPCGPQYVVALAACEGRGAVLLAPGTPADTVAAHCADAGVVAAFTMRALASHLPTGMPMVLLDAAPASAQVIIGGLVQDIRLETHRAMRLDGESGDPGRDEEAVVVYGATLETRRSLTHRDLLASADAAARAPGFVRDVSVTPSTPFWELDGLTAALTAPLLAGGRVTTTPPALRR